MASVPVRALSRALLADGDGHPRIRFGRVSAASSPTVDVEVGGDTSAPLTGVPYLASYGAPAVGDLVVLLLLGPPGGPYAAVVLGRVGTSAARGTISGTTNGSGDFTVTHGLGVIPTHIDVQERNPGGVSAWTNTRVITVTTTTFTMRVLGINAAVLTNTSIDGTWEAWA